MRAELILLALCLSISGRDYGRSYSNGRTFLQNVSAEDRREYKNLLERWDLSANEQIEKALKWGEKLGIKDKVQKYIEKRRKEEDEVRKKFGEIIGSLTSLGKEFLETYWNGDKIRALVRAYIDKFRAEHEQQYEVLNYALQLAKERSKSKEKKEEIK
ncbi:hypothetical protein RB195_001668 [Necator americanus]|uniref:SXP/RAL-2 family protein Ani s 5-like cation-binding domain-containing protein n=1 Tax=Necator americanus TaxID=51031 RepID=A0ABR1DGZ0_NECAM